MILLLFFLLSTTFFQYRKNALGEPQKTKLIDIGFVWSIRPGRLKHPLPPLESPLEEPAPAGQTCIMGKEDDGDRDVEPYSVDRNGYLII
mmetsp:Transcript_20019/g.49186  ORF Transcript_20019/g.49186 Transcript_20019/m.49186 type:complete len:90 (+) Transcript_20019:29-298(+)